MKHSLSYLSLLLSLIYVPTLHAQSVELQADVPEVQLQEIPPDEIKLRNLSVLLPHKITDKQQQLLLKAYIIAKEDGHKDPELLPAVIFQETRAGAGNFLRETVLHLSAKYREKCFGVGQIKLQATKAVLKKYPELRDEYLIKNTDEEIVTALMLNDEFNIKVASKYLRMMEPFGSNTSSWKAAAYNRGPGGAKGHDLNSLGYVKSVTSFMNRFKKFIID